MDEAQINNAIAEKLGLNTYFVPCQDLNDVALAESKLSIAQKGELLARIVNIVHTETKGSGSAYFATANQKARALFETLCLETGVSKKKKK